MKLLEGVVTEPMDDGADDLRDEIRELRRELSAAKSTASQATREASRATAELRRQLQPLYRALQAVFGELDSIGGSDDEPVTPGNPRVAQAWEVWKQKMRGQAAQIIDALMLHRELTSQQIAIHIGIHRKNVPQLIFKLNKAGLINKNGDRYSLKQL